MSQLGARATMLGIPHHPPKGLHLEEPWDFKGSQPLPIRKRSGSPCTVQSSHRGRASGKKGRSEERERGGRECELKDRATHSIQRFLPRRRPQVSNVLGPQGRKA